MNLKHYKYKLKPDPGLNWSLCLSVCLEILKICLGLKQKWLKLAQIFVEMTGNDMSPQNTETDLGKMFKNGPQHLKRLYIITKRIFDSKFMNPYDVLWF